MKNSGLICRLYSNIYYSFYKRHDSFYFLVVALMRLYRVAHRRINPLHVNGGWMNVQLNDPGISTELAISGVHEPISTWTLTKFLKKEYYCLDIGANMGYYTLLTAGLIGKEGKILAVEPHPENFSILRENVSMNGLRNVTCLNAACSSYDGYGRMKIMPQSNWHSLLKDGNNSGLRVRVRKVDTLAKSFERLDFMRMDVEGHEDKVIEGSYKTIETFRPSLFLEFHPTLAGKDSTLKLLAELKNYGYKIDHFIPRFLDWPLVGRISHAKKLSIDEYMNKIEKADPIDGREANVFLSA